MYAVIESGGRQHRVTEGEVLRLDKLDVAVTAGSDGEGDGAGGKDGQAAGQVVFDRVLMVGDIGKDAKGGKGAASGSDASEKDAVKIGTPYLEGSRVTAQVLRHGRGEKIRIVKLKRRKHSRKQMGHRQWFTEVRITGINP